MAPADVRGIRVLCYGDSLTAGFYGAHNDYCPYATRLSQVLGVQADAVGLSGWRVDQMVNNMDNPFCVDTFHQAGCGLAVQLQKKKYDICIIMAGTNDLGANRSAGEILNDLKALHQYCHSQGVRTIALSIPESGCLGDPAFRMMAMARRTVNAGLLDWAARKPKNTLYVDMASHVPFSVMSPNWHPDGLHMSRQGYMTFGEKLSKFVLVFIEDTFAEAPQPAPGRIALRNITNTRNAEDAKLSKNGGARTSRALETTTAAFKPRRHFSATSSRTGLRRLDHSSWPESDSLFDSNFYSSTIGVPLRTPSTIYDTLFEGPQFSQWESNSFFPLLW